MSDVENHAGIARVFICTCPHALRRRFLQCIILRTVCSTANKCNAFMMYLISYHCPHLFWIHCHYLDELYCFPEKKTNIWLSTTHFKPFKLLTNDSPGKKFKQKTNRGKKSLKTISSINENFSEYSKESERQNSPRTLRKRQKKLFPLQLNEKNHQKSNKTEKKSEKPQKNRTTSF